ncbi:MAG: protein kinase [Chloroflexota bacterium]|nr:protein kinase [Chloroflexota bacterium]
MDLKSDMILHERYRIIKKLGQGGMGSVHLAWDQTLGIQVAVKRNINSASESVAQFMKEAQLLAALRHQNLPRVTDYFLIGNEQYLVMDYIPGNDLDQCLTKEGAQKIENVLSWCSQLSDALTYMHNQDPPVIHRDIKPANIKLTTEDKAILVDFGIAKADSVQALTATGASGYSPGYAPPEQYGQGHTGPFSDQFSLAATMYALLSGRKPADSIERVLGKAAIIPVCDLNPLVPRNISDAILKAMSLQTSDRFESVQAFQNAMENPAFCLTPKVKETISNTIVKNGVSPARHVNQSPQGTLLEPEKRKNRKRNVILIMFGSLVGISTLIVLIFVLFPPKNLIRLITRREVQPPTDTATVPATQTQPIVVQESTLTSTETEQVVLQGPTETMTLEPTSTEIPELVGQSGVIAFSSDRGEGAYVQIWTMRVIINENSDIIADSFVQLTFDESHKDQPVWSPDGSKIVYVAQGSDVNGLDIWIMDANGENQINLTQAPGDEFDPEWSPDGSRIVFTHHYRDSGSSPIYGLVWMSDNGTDRQRLSVDYIEMDPTFSPDMKWLLYVISARSHDYLYFRAAFDDFQSPRNFDIRDLFGKFGEVSDPSWGPKGNQFAFTRHSGSQSDIVLVVYETMQQNGLRLPKEYVLTDTHTDTDAAWSTDARWLAFTSTRDRGDQEVYIMTTTGRPQVNLSASSGVDRSPSWKPFIDINQ